MTLNTHKYLPSSATQQHLILGLAAILLLIALVTFLISLRAKANYDARWKLLQKMLANKSTWKDAVLEADKLLDSMLKKRHFKGKTMGERLVAAQHELSANDMVWFSHKLSNKIVNEGADVTKAQVKKALLGFWRALKDLGAFGKKETKLRLGKKKDE